MRTLAKATVAVLVCGLGLSISGSISWAENAPRPAALTSDDRLSVIAAALDSRLRPSSQRDCSHFVHTVYERAGLPYKYASSSDLYAGVEEFQRVVQPQSGDLVVWRGHVGIVIQPSRHIFFSLMRGGPGIDDYEATYWKSRGRPRFYSYLMSDRVRNDRLKSDRRNNDRPKNDRLLARSLTR
jgi:hypothetical protein